MSSRLAWGVALMSLALLVFRAPALPDPLPVLRSFSGEPTAWSPKTLLVVCRVALMNLAFLGIASIMVREVRAARALGWLRFFTWSQIAIALKTLSESTQVALLGTRYEASASPWLFGATALSVLGFLFAAATLAARRQLGSFPRLGRRATAGVIVCLIAWALLVVIPLWG